MELVILSILIIPGTLYLLISAAVKTGVYNALIKYDEYKDQKKNTQ